MNAIKEEFGEGRTNGFCGRRYALDLLGFSDTLQGHHRETVFASVEVFIMKRLAMIGTQLIHTYPYAAYFNGCDPELFKANAKPWMVKMYEDRPAEQVSKQVRVTHVWGGEPEEAEKLAAACLIPNVAASFDDMVGEVDGVMVMDENVPERAGLMRPYVEAGKAVFVDKILSLDPATTSGLLDLADDKGGPIAAWSQLRFAPGFEEIEALGRGGIGLATFRLDLDKMAAYAIHLISAVHGVFGHGAGAHVIYRQAKGPQVFLGYRDGTRLILHIAPNAPAQWHIYYLNFARDGGASQ